MQGLYYFIVKPVESRYNNTKKIGDKSLITNTENFTHQNVNRNAIVTVSYTHLRAHET